MSGPYSDISIMEELDPEPPDKNRGPIREFVLGFVLLVAVLGWASWLWWQQETHLGNYRLAEQAATLRDWDAARSYFLAAADYRDASSRAAQIARLIAERDRNYQDARGAIEEERLVDALGELQEVQRLQPEYRDVALLLNDVETRVYRHALDGAIGMRTDANPPGLYYRTGDRWLWLEGSDERSRVLAANNGDVAYDVPGPDWRAGPTPTPVPDNRTSPPGAPQLAGRKLKVATLGAGTLATRDSTLDPAFYNSYILSNNRIVARRTNKLPNTPTYAARSVENGLWVDYEYVEQGRTMSATLSTGGVEESFLDIAPEHDLYVVAVIKGTSLRRSKLELYLGRKRKGEDGAFQRQLVYTHTGQFGSAQLSPDGRYMLLTTIVPSQDYMAETQTALLFDLVAGTPPYTLSTRTVPVETTGNFVLFGTWIKGVFLTQGAYAGQVLLVEQTEQGSDIRLYDTAQPGQSTLVAQVDGMAEITYAREQPGGSEVLIGGRIVEEGSASIYWDNARLFFVRIAPGMDASVTHLSRSNGGYLYIYDVAGDRLIYEERVFGPVGWPGTVYSVAEPEAEGGSQVAPVRLLDSASPRPRENGNADDAVSQQPSWHAGDGLFAYIQGGSIYVREYDSPNEVRLETGVTQLFSPRLYFSLRQLR